MDPLTSDQIKKELQGLKNWSFENDKIHKDFSFDNFKDALSFIVRIGFEAESLGHHPELSNVYNSVSISLSTHDAGDKVTEKDIKLAKAIDTVYQSN